MRRILFTIQYKGTLYSGWQRQANAPSVQAAIEDAIYTITGERVIIHGSGRTDTGVHAMGQTAHADIEHTISLGRLMTALNAKLSSDISVVNAKEAASDFHARYSAKSKTYLYRLYIDRVGDVFFDGLRHRVLYDLDTATMLTAAKHLKGKHDFASFAASGSSAKTTVRTISNIEIVTKDKEIDILVTADGFLYNMVRIIVAALIKVGCGKILPDDMPSILECRDRRYTQAVAPACGLYLLEVKY